MRATDWSQTPLGPVENWSQSLRTAVGIMLSSRYAMFVWWGRQLINLYNDAYRPFLGKKHPGSLGQSARDVWAEIWDLIGPRTEAVLEQGESTFDEALLLVMERYGYPEETYFTFSYSPIRDGRGDIGGLFCAVTDETSRVIGERRLKLLREVAATAPETHTPEQVCAAAAACISRNAHDLPFAMLYLSEGDGRGARLAARVGIDPEDPAAPPLLDLEDDNAIWPLAKVKTTGGSLVIEELQSRFAHLPRGVWDRPPARAVVMPLSEQGQTGIAGFLVAGINPYLLFEEGYSGFVGLLAGQIAAAIANARAYEEERKRADALAEIDRAKTAFFSNVSHEFRTPLTLMLGPLEDALAAPAGALAQRRGDLALAHRNGLRLLRLVNTLLDFSRIEAGRVEASYEPVDLATATADLASVFRAATDRAGLRFAVDCPPLGEPVWVDRDMWEKIVLNLLSNAFKFTFAGGIAVRLRREDASAALTVEDTGTGIPAHEIPRLFDRFHRVEGARGRTHEGTGIGLALVQELVRLHGGAVRAESVAGAGSTFTVTIPLGTAHLPPDRLGAERMPADTGLGAQPFVEEALRWLPDADAAGEPGIERDLLREQHPPAPAAAAGGRATILVADDNADMRDYLRRLLGARYAVRAVADGEEALAALRAEPPDLLLSDIMMPRMDGYALLRAVRADPGLADLPVVLLSARAGEEASVEGLDAGADDYLVKPFSARELLARVAANLETARLRRTAEQSLRRAYQETADILESIDDAFFAVDQDWRLTFVNHHVETFWGKRRAEVLGQKLLELFPHAAGTPLYEAMSQAMRERRIVSCEALSVAVARGRWVRGIFYPNRTGISVYLRDVTEQKQAEAALRESERRSRELLEALPAAMYTTDAAGRITYCNQAAVDLAGRQPALGDDEWCVSWRLFSPDGAPIPHDQCPMAMALKENRPIRGQEVIAERPDGTRVPLIPYPTPLHDASGALVGAVNMLVDITERKESEAALRENEEQFRTLAESIPQLAWMAHADGWIFWYNQRWYDYTGTTLEEMRGWGWRKVHHPDHEERVVRRVQHSWDTGEVWEDTFPLRGKDGQYRWFLSRAVPLRNAAGRVTRWFGTNTDITEQREAQEALRHLTKMLEERVAERTRALEAEIAERQKIEAALRQSQRLEAIGRLTGGIAHDFNNLLTVVIGQAEAIATAAEDNPRITRMAAAAQRAAERGAQLTGQLLSFSGRQQLRPAAIAVDRLIRDIGDLLRRAVGEAITVETAADPELWPSYIDPAQFESAILNLAINARDAMPEGGRLVIAARNARIASGEGRRLDLRAGDYIVASVGDSGVGMTPEVQRRAFEPFFTTKDIGKGTGLGLAQIYGFAKQSGGTATIASAPGQGTNVALYLPRAVAPAVEEPAAEQAATLSGAGRTILVVEDQPEVREVIETSLGELGYRVLTAPDGAAARAVLKSDQTIDLLLSDVVMPNGVSGLDLAREARRLRQDLKIVLVSGYLRDTGGRHDALSDLLFLEKPFRLSDLAEAVAAALAGRPRARTELAE